MILLDLDADVSLKRLEEILRSSKECATHLRRLGVILAAIPHIGFKLRVSIDPFFIHGDRLYSGTIFQLSLDDRRRSDSIAAGGFYEELLDSYRYPTDRTRQVGAVGVVFQHSKLVALRSLYGVKTETDPMVLVYATSAGMLGEKMDVAAMLWDSHINVEVLDEGVTNSEHANQIARTKGSLLSVQLRENTSRGAFGLVRVRNYEHRQEYEISRGELVDNIRAAINEGDRDQPAGGRQEGASEGGTASAYSSFAPLNVTLFAPFGKVKGFQKSVVMEKAVRAMGPLMASFSGLKPIEIVAHDVGKDVIRRVIDSLSEPAEYLKKALDARDDRDAALKLKALLEGLREKKPFVLLYNYKDGFVDIVSLFGSS